MSETKTTYEQFCTHQGKNVLMETIMKQSGVKITKCTNFNCQYNSKDCKNKLKPK